MKEEALQHGWGEPEWLFPNDEGHPPDESRVRKAFKRALTRAKLPAFRLYDLRHTLASLLLAAGAPITRIRRRRCATTRDGFRAGDDAGWICWIASRTRCRRQRSEFPGRFGTRFGTKQPGKPKSGTPVIPKCRVIPAT
jgi:hypothetical protein